MKALFIGRFQPFHNGHLKVIKEASSEYDKIIIGIGSSQYSDTVDNPFSGYERKKMISKSLKNNDVNNYEIIFIPDIHNPPKWVEHVYSIIPDFDIVLSHNDFALKLFKDKNFKVKKTQFYNKKMYSGKEIRRRIKENREWENLVPEKVKKVMYEIDGVNRIKKLT